MEIQNQPILRDGINWASLGMFTSSIFAFFGIAFLVLLYIGLFTGTESLYRFGLLNDVFTIFQFVLTVPAAIKLHEIYKNTEPRISQAALFMNLLGVSMVAVFQALLVTGVMSFVESLGFVVFGGILFGGWILLVSRLSRVTNSIPLSRRLAILAFFYIGYPLWALRVGRGLKNSVGGIGLE